MSDLPTRRPSVGSTTDDLCRACKLVRRHTVMAADAERILRVVCDYCGSQHNYRGGGPAKSRGTPRSSPGPTTSQAAFPLVSERERSHAPMSDHADHPDLELLLRRVIREESGLTAVAPADKWHGGELVLRPGREGVQEKTLPIETFFHKIVMLRNRLRTMEQQINGADIPNELKLKLQSYLTGCYGTLTSFNVLFADEDDRFKGSGGK